MPRLLKRRGRLPYLLAILSTGGLLIWAQELIRDKFMDGWIPGGHFSTVAERVGMLPFVLTFILIWAVSSGLWLLREWQQSERRLEASERERIAAEFAQLKSQLNPHFLFNTLNGIYTLSLLKSDATPQAIIQLSNLMSYVLTDAGADLVPLEKDLEHLRYFIELGKMRLTELSPVTFDVDEGAGDGGLLIAPLLLLPFVENAFQHGISSSERSPVFIKITIVGKRLDFFCENKILSSGYPAAPQHGIGIANTRRRIELAYPDRHRLDIAQTEGHFRVTLQLVLD